MKNLQRINVKLYLQDSNMLKDEQAFRIFNEWITSSTNEVLVDAADYSHVGQGPTTILVGHDANYCLYNDDNKKGLLYTRKQPQEGELIDRLSSAIFAGLNACKRFEDHPELIGRVRFDGSKILVTANDRLNAPYNETNLQLLKKNLTPTFDRLFLSNKYHFSNEGSPDERLSILVSSNDYFTVEDLLNNLNQGPS